MSLFKKIFGGSGGGNVTFQQTQRQADGNTYDVYTAPTRDDALAFLRQHEVKEERRYAIVETPQGNIGKDFIMIFDERTQGMIELAQRQPLAAPRKSASHCCRCRSTSLSFFYLCRLIAALLDDTMNLSIGSGLNSGPTTVGSLHGEKIGFLFFGDTVNTTGRMESNRQRDKAHVPKSPMDELIAAGKGHWLIKRE